MSDGSPAATSVSAVVINYNGGDRTIRCLEALNRQTTPPERMTLAPGGRRIELHWLGRSHTDNLIVPFIPDVGVALRWTSCRTAASASRRITTTSPRGGSNTRRGSR